MPQKNNYANKRFKFEFSGLGISRPRPDQPEDIRVPKERVFPVVLESRKRRGWANHQKRWFGRRGC